MHINSTDDYRLARGRIAIAIKRLAAKYSFHARILEQFQLQHRPDIKTMGVTVNGDTIQLLINPMFVLDITIDELGGVLLHETYHVVFGHIVADRANYPDQWARLIAEEVTANEFIIEPLPRDPIRLSQFPMLPPEESTDQRYARLERDIQLATSGLPDSTNLESGGQAETGDGSSGSASPDNKSDATSPQSTIDDHSVWQEAGVDLENAAAVLRNVVQEAVIDMGFNAVPEFLHSSLHDLGIGCTPGKELRRLNASGRGQLNWVRLLRRYVGRQLAMRCDLRFPPRRFPQLVGVYPGKRRRASRPHILAVLDTSGSMTPELLDQVNRELARLALDYRVTVAECDSEIHRVYSYRRIKAVMGEGGTDFCPPFEQQFLQKHRPDLVIYFTDGDGPAPDSPPRIPVLWCLTPSGQQPTEWGQVVQMTHFGDL